MKILLLHNRYQRPGGEDIVVHTEKSLLESHGHHISYLEIDNDNIISPVEKVKAAVNSVYSVSSKKLVREKIAHFRPDLVHIHNFFPQFSPSIYYACREAKVPIIQSLHNYRLFCVNSTFFRNGQVCEDCLGKAFPLPGVVHGCYRGSKAGSAVLGTMQFVHRTLGTWEKMVDRYITLTEFARHKFIQGNLPESKLVVKPNFVYPDPGMGNGEGEYALFVGRLSFEKGITTLLKAWEKLGKQIPLKIIGDGPLAPQVIQATQGIGVEWLGHKSSEDVYELMGQAKFLVICAESYETFGLVAIEAFAKGTPVIASNIGAFAELIQPHVNGLLFNPGDSVDLISKVESLLKSPEILGRMRQAARAEFEAKYTAEKNYQKLMDIYRGVLSSDRLSVQPHQLSYQ